MSPALPAPSGPAPFVTWRILAAAALLALLVGLLAYGSLLVPRDLGRAAP